VRLDGVRRSVFHSRRPDAGYYHHHGTAQAQVRQVRRPAVGRQAGPSSQIVQFQHGAAAAVFLLVVSRFDEVV
jgi:hypothetical protein